MLWLTGGNVYDVERGAFRRADVAVRDQRIEAIVGAGEPARDDVVIDLAGAWLLPGLIDCHVHLAMPTELADPAAAAQRPDAAVALYAAKAAERTLLGGITTARDVGGWNYVEMAVREAIEAGLCVGPRLFLAGRLLSVTTATVDYYPGMYEVANGPEEVRRAARKQLAMGADLVKVMATGAMLSAENEDARAIQYTLDELKAAVEIGRDNYKPVAAHAHACRGIANAIEAGCDSVEHGTFADEAVLQRMAEKGTYLVPTNCVFGAMLGDNRLMQSMSAHHRQRLVDSHEIHNQAMRAARRLGVRIAMGTDAGTPGNHHGRNAQECALMVSEIGMTPQESLYCATMNPAKLLRQDGNLGSLDVGKYADIVACRRNPLDDIGEIVRIAFVMKGGVAYKNELTRR